MRLLLLESDLATGAHLRQDLCSDDHLVEWCQRLADVPALQAEPYDMLLVDCRLADGSGVDWLRAQRRAGNTTPALIIAAPDVPGEGVRALDNGADDYVVKPVERDELRARMRAVRRRTSGFGSPLVAFGVVELDLNAKAAYVDGRSVPLTAREWSVLEALVLRTGRVVSKRNLEALVVGLEGGLASNAIEVHVSNIRRKLDHRLIETVRGVGYRMATFGAMAA